MRYRFSRRISRGSEPGSRPRAGRRALAALAFVALWAPSWTVVAGQEPEPGRPAERAQEDALLGAAFRYLDLSHGQRGQLLWAARQIEGRRQMFADEERRVQAEAQPSRDPENAARLKQMLDRDRAQMEADVLAFAAPHLVRTLTRTQILLAWRLEQGRPPKAYPADPILLDPAAGFVVSAPGIVTYFGALDRTYELAPGGDAEGQVRAERALIDEARARAEQARATAELARAEQERALAEYERELVLAQEETKRLQELNRDLEVVTMQVVASPLSNPHFPQRVVESDSVDELVAAIEPFARRLFTSPRLAAVLARGGGPAAGRKPARPAGSPRLVRDYRLGRDFRDVRHRGPDLEPLGGGIEEGLYRFGAGQGLLLADTGVTDHYAAEMIFGCTGMEGYQKLIDFKQRAVDEGLYLLNNRLTFYNLADGGPAPPGMMHRLRLERDRATRLVRAYLDRQYAFAFLDLDDDAAFKEQRGFLFVDDKMTTNEQGPGVLSSVQVWDRPEGR